MSCPKCKAKVGLMKHELVLDAGVIFFKRCVICGYWSEPFPTYKQDYRERVQNSICNENVKLPEHFCNINAV
jgi:hypothetical protein